MIRQITKISETIMLVILLFATALCVLPIWENNMFLMVVHLLMLVAIVLFAALFWREGEGDERDVAHKMFAGRLAFFAGIITLSVGVAWQVRMMETVDVFLIAALVVMIIAKIIGRLYSQRHC